MTPITDENVGTIEIGGRRVRRLGFGAMRIEENLGAADVELTEDELAELEGASD